jgi:hypothetical protein
MRHFFAFSCPNYLLSRIGEVSARKVWWWVGFFPGDYILNFFHQQGDLYYIPNLYDGFCFELSYAVTIKCCFVNHLCDLLVIQHF